VGEALVDYLTQEGAKVIISDIYEDRVKDVVNKYMVEAVNPDEVYDVDMDIYAPCALGATINDETLKKLKCSVIVGAANNQLADEERHGKAVMDLGILYAPDFLVNAGGIINCYWEVIGYNRDAAMAQTEDIYNTTLKIFKRSSELGIPTYLAANQLAEQRVEAIGKTKQYF
jgi:leucine dehydrogenase